MLVNRVTNWSPKIDFMASQFCDVEFGLHARENRERQFKPFALKGNGNEMKRRMRSSLVFILLNYTHGFQNVNNRYSPSKIFRNVIANDEEPILDKTHRLLQAKAPFDERFDAMIRPIFPNAINNNDFEYGVVATLAERGFSARNTLLATSLCSDETAKVLSDDFVNIYGSNFNLGGLAGYPFAGNIGFQTMCGHIPDDGFCLFVFGPHVGVTTNGARWKEKELGLMIIVVDLPLKQQIM